MIIEKIWEWIVDGISSMYTGLIDLVLPSLPDSVYSVLATFLSHLNLGVGILANYVDLPFLLSLLAVVIGVDASIYAYRLVMWFLAKLPLLNLRNR